MSYTRTFDIHLGAAYAGLTLAAQLIDTAGDDVGSEIASGFVEINGGDYLLTATIATNHRGGIVVYESGAPSVILAVGAINPEDAEDVIAIKAKTDALDTSAFQGVSGIDGDTLTLVMAVDFAETASGLTIPANWQKCYWTAKEQIDDDDDDAVFQVVVTNGGDDDDGLLWFEGDEPDEADLEADDAGLAVNQGAGTVAMTMNAMATAAFEKRRPAGVYYDLKFIEDDGSVPLASLVRGVCKIVRTATQARG